MFANSHQLLDKNNMIIIIIGTLLTSMPLSTRECVIYERGRFVLRQKSLRKGHLPLLPFSQIQRNDDQTWKNVTEEVLFDDFCYVS